MGQFICRGSCTMGWCCRPESQGSSEPDSVRQWLRHFSQIDWPDFIAGLNSFSQEGRQRHISVGADALTIVDRLDRFASKHPQTMPVVDQDPLKPSALPTLDSYEFLTAWGQKKSSWKNEVTVKSYVFPSGFSTSLPLLRSLLTFVDAASKPCANTTLLSTSIIFHVLLF